MATFHKSRLLEYPEHKLRLSATAQMLDAILNDSGGVIPLLSRYAGRSFCRAGKRLRLRDKDYHPQELVTPDGQLIQLDEWWGCYASNEPIVTGSVLRSTGRPPVNEGMATTITPDGHLLMFHELIATAPERILGKALVEHSKAILGYETWTLVSKIYDNLNPIPWHLHFRKKEAHDPNEYLNPGLLTANYFCTAMGLYPWVTKEQLLEALKYFEKDDAPYNNLRQLSPAVRIMIGWGFMMENMVGHAPVELATKEIHLLMDEHILLENMTADGRLSLADAMGAVDPMDLPKALQGNWEHFVWNKFDWARNQDPCLSRDAVRPPLHAPEFSGDGYDTNFIIYGAIGGVQEFTSMRTIVQPGATATMRYPAPCFFHINSGKGKVNKYNIALAPRITVGKVYNENGFVPDESREDVAIVNTSRSKPLAITQDFTRDAFPVTPGTGITPRLILPC